MIIETPRTTLRCWSDRDRDAFAAMNADPEVMADLGGPIGRHESDAKLDRYRAAFDARGLSRWVIESKAGAFLGYAGILHHVDHVIGAHADIAWRLVRSAWGNGLATEAASAALDDAFTRGKLTEVLAYTAPDNLRSQAVMTRLQMQRDTSRDFTTTYPGMGQWRGLAWVARAA